MQQQHKITRPTTTKKQTELMQNDCMDIQNKKTTKNKMDKSDAETQIDHKMTRKKQQQQ